MRKLLLLLLSLILLNNCGLDIGSSSKGDSQESSIINNNNGEQSAPGFGDNPVCPYDNSLDGPGGFLWKPVSEGDGRLVVLFPREYVSPFRRVLSLRGDGTGDAGTFTGFTNDDRQTYRFPLRGEEYIGTVIVDDTVQECRWHVPNPSEVQD